MPVWPQIYFIFHQKEPGASWVLMPVPQLYWFQTGVFQRTSLLFQRPRPGRYVSVGRDHVTVGVGVALVWDRDNNPSTTRLS